MFFLLVIHRFLMEEIRESVLEEFKIGGEGVHKLLKELHLVTGKLSDSGRQAGFFRRRAGTIEDVMFDKWGLRRFVPGAG